MAKKYLDDTGLLYFWGKLKTWVGNYVKITSSTGKDTVTAGNNSIDIYDWAQASTKPSYTFDELTAGSTNKAFTDTEKTKLSGISAGAEVNQNAFSNVKVGSDTIAADGKTDTLELAAASNSVVSLTADTSGDKVTFDVDKDLSKYDNSTSGFITTADVPEGAAASTVTPVMDGTAAKGTDNGFARGDHVHPTDTSRVAANAAITGATKTKITYDSKGLVTAGADLSASDIPDLSSTYIAATTKGAANGVCPLDANTKIASTYLPSYVDDVVEAYARTGQTALSSTWLATGSASGSAITPEAGVIYVLMADSGDYAANTQFRWGGSAYVKLNDGGVSAITTGEIDTIVAS